MIKKEIAQELCTNHVSSAHNYMPTARMLTDHTGTADFRCVGISSFAVNECVGWLVQISLTLFAVTGSARLAEGVNAKSMRLTCTSQPTQAKLEIPTQWKSAVVDYIAHVHACKTHVHAHVSCMFHACYTHVTRMLHACNTHVTRMQHACNTHATCMFRHMLEYACFMHVTCM